MTSCLLYILLLHLHDHLFALLRQLLDHRRVFWGSRGWDHQDSEKSASLELAEGHLGMCCAVILL